MNIVTQGYGETPPVTDVSYELPQIIILEDSEVIIFEGCES